MSFKYRALEALLTVTSEEPVCMCDEFIVFFLMVWYVMFYVQTLPNYISNMWYAVCM